MKHESGKCSRCHKNPVTRPARICQPCIHKPKRRRTSRATARPGVGRAAAVLQRSTATSWPVASAAWYEAQPDSGKGGQS